MTNEPNVKEKCCVCNVRQKEEWDWANEADQPTHPEAVKAGERICARCHDLWVVASDMLQKETVQRSPDQPNIAFGAPADKVGYRSWCHKIWVLKEDEYLKLGRTYLFHGPGLIIESYTHGSTRTEERYVNDPSAWGWISRLLREGLDNVGVPPTEGGECPWEVFSKTEREIRQTENSTEELTVTD